MRACANPCVNHNLVCATQLEPANLEWDAQLDAQVPLGKHAVPSRTSRRNASCLAAICRFATLLDGLDPELLLSMTAACQASKAGVLGLTQAGAAKLVYHGIRVNAVSPSATATVRHAPRDHLYCPAWVPADLPRQRARCMPASGTTSSRRSIRCKGLCAASTLCLASYR